jgi:hypothetical protein
MTASKTAHVGVAARAAVVQTAATAAVERAVATAAVEQAEAVMTLMNGLKSSTNFFVLTRKKYPP